MPSPTVYPFRQVLTMALRQIILDVAVPAINADILAQMTAAGLPPASIPRFDDSSVVTGDLSPVSQATLCILDGGEDNIRAGTEGYFMATLRTQLQLKTPAIGDNSPEDFSLLGQVVSDTLRDLLTSNPVILPQTGSGQNLLPAGMHFQDCFYSGARSLNFPQREEDKVTYTRGWVFMHSASIGYFQNRPNSLGS